MTLNEKNKYKQLLKKIITILILLILANWASLLFYIPFYDTIFFSFDGSLNIPQLILAIVLFVFCNTLVFGVYSLTKLKFELRDLHEWRKNK